LHIEDEQRLITEAYTRLVSHLSAILYDEDPVGVGSGTARGWKHPDDDFEPVPLDEYESHAARLAAALRQHGGEVDPALTAVFDGPDYVLTRSMIERVEQVWRSFSASVRRYTG
jgi:hypothetical protein